MLPFGVSCEQQKLPFLLFIFLPPDMTQVFHALLSEMVAVAGEQPLREILVIKT